MHRILPEFVKSGWTRHRQRSLTVLPWDDFQKQNDRRYDSVAVVGNAGYLVDLDQGRMIDDHELVIRLNNFQTTGFERQIGSRCDVFLTSFFTDIRYRRPEITGVRQIVASVPNTFRKARRSFLHHRYAEHILEGMEQLDRREVFVPSLGTFFGACNTCQAVPSTGFMAILFALQYLRWNRLLVTGFSFFRGREHYFNQPGAPRPRHDFERERLLVASMLMPLVADGGVRTDTVMQDDIAEAVR
jgi:hypothetical protein